MLKTLYYFLCELRNIPACCVNTLLFRLAGVSCLSPMRHFKGYLTVRTASRHAIRIGYHMRINSGSSYNPLGQHYRTILRTIGSGCISIGNNVGISNSSCISAASITIGNDVLIGDGVRIYDTDFHEIDFEARVHGASGVIVSRPVKLCDGCFIGTGAMILKGVTIGERSIIGAGAVVTKSVPAGEIWGGNPARCLKKLPPQDND